MVKHCRPFGDCARDVEKLYQISGRREANTQLRACGITQKISLKQAMELTAYAGNSFRNPSGRQRL
jgi:hypothetical protein